MFRQLRQVFFCLSYVLQMCVMFCFLVFGCQYQCNRLRGKTHLCSDPLCVKWHVKPDSLILGAVKFSLLWQVQLDALKDSLRAVERVLCINTHHQPLAVYRGLRPTLDPLIPGQRLISFCRCRALGVTRQRLSI